MKQIGDGACTAPWPLQMEWLIFIPIFLPHEPKIVKGIPMDPETQKIPPVVVGFETQNLS